MQTILGSSGIIGTQLAGALYKSTSDLKLVSRNPHKIHKSDILVSANLLNKEQTLNAVEGSDVVYLTVGLPYKLSVWEEQWPLIMKNVIRACKAHGSKLVFFDSVIVYGKVKGWMTEQTPINPCSLKGKVRAKVAHMLMDSVEKGDIDALITRSVHFYGPDTPLSYLNTMVVENLIKGRRAQVMIRDDHPHSFAYTPDISKATALLGNTPEAFNQVWHLPTDKNVLTGKELIDFCSHIIGKSGEEKYQILNPWMLRLAGIFNSNIRETVEMLYQFENDYLFDSSKFDKEFDFQTTSYADGLRKTIEFYLHKLSQK